MYVEQLLISIRTLFVLSLLTGVVYPLAMTGVAQKIFPRQANGSLLYRDGKAVGSEWIGQTFDSPGYFWGRLSATGPVPYNGAASSGSNFGPLNPALHDAVRGRIAALRKVDPENTDPVPVDLVTSSASGLDPHISPAAAHYQLKRVARARGISDLMVETLVRNNTSGRFLGVIGEARVNVLTLNLQLDELANGHATQP
jgi:K+-transporting ATPase ATPase C chain